MSIVNLFFNALVLNGTLFIFTQGQKCSQFSKWNVWLVHYIIILILQLERASYYTISFYC